MGMKRRPPKVSGTTTIYITKDTNDSDFHIFTKEPIRKINESQDIFFEDGGEMLSVCEEGIESVFPNINVEDGKFAKVELKYEVTGPPVCQSCSEEIIPDPEKDY
jgi:hypothetical protein